MNHDDQKPDLSTLIDPELEARIVAWVSGEASPFEASELTRLTNEKPELAIFKRRIEAVRGLVGEAIRPDPVPLRLAPERRVKLLQALGANENKTNSSGFTNTAVLPLAAAKKEHRKDRRWMYAIAASFAVGLFTLMSIPSFQRIRESKMVVMELPLAADANAYESEPAKRESNGSGRTIEERQRGLKEREAAYKQAIDQATKRKIERDVAEIRSEQSSRPAALAKSSKRGFAIAPPPPGGAPSSDAYNSPSLGLVGDVGAEKKTDTSLASPRADYFNPSAPAPAEQPQAGGKANTLVASLEPSQETVVLSPFEVTSSEDKGYAAKDTLAGSRLNSQLRDVSSAVTVVTKGFLQDVGATDSKNLLAYTSNTEVGGTRTSQAGKEVDAISADLPLEKAKALVPVQTLTEINASKEPVSTFSLHVSDVSFRLAQAALAKGEELDRASIRPEEFYNAFSYGDPTPALAEKVSCRIEQAAHPFIQQRNLVRIAVKVAAAGRDAAQPLHLTVLLDTSGSMEREDRAATIQSAMKALTSLLGPNDRLTLIGFSRQPRLLAESLSGDQAAQVLDLIKNTPAEGGTNLEEAQKLGSELARRQFNVSAQNRIVLLTDGAANLGNANPVQLAASIEALRQSGIAFDACGVGLEGLDDGMLENLTRKGDGRYYVLNSPESADAGFAKQLAGAFRPAAENVKLQVRFNPARVGHYRLIGFEQHRLNEEDFRNDKVDAAELAAEEAAVAVYQVEALPQGEGELGEVYVRFRDTASGNMVERSWTLNYDAQARAFDRATPSMQLAGTAALLAEKLQGSEAAAAINLGDLAPIVNKLRSHYANEPRVQELVTMFEQARKLAGE